ncbi:MAG: hypothetical protein IJS60_03710 [Abditibacteriota bacterium]|nr:hypothetical protein [Abditibacteriota bacterium]
MKKIILFIIFLIIIISFTPLLFSENLKVEINNLTDNITETKSLTKNKTVFKDAGFEIYVTPKTKNGYKSYNIKVVNTDLDKEKAAIVSVLCPTKGEGWTWYYDVCAQAECQVGKTYFEQDYKHPANPDFEFSSWPTFINGRRETPLPIGVISNKNKSITMGYFMDEPRVYRIKYSQSLNQGEMRLEVDLGFSSETKEPGVGDFTFFALEKSKPTTFREALKEYYDKCPQYFEDKNFLGRDREHGMWTLWMQKNVFAPWDFQIGYNQIQANREDVEEKGLAGWQEPVLSYTEPWGIYQMFPVKDGYKRDIQAFVYNPLETPELERMLKKHASADPNLIDTYIYNVKEAEAGQCALDTGVFCDQFGHRYSMHWFGCYNIRPMTDEQIEEEWGTPLQYSMVVCNPNPNLPHPNRFDLSMKECDIKGFDGYQLDSFNEFCGQHVDNYRKEHFKYESIPLCYGADSKIPCQSHVFESMEYLKALREKADSEGKNIIASNTWHPCITFSAPLLDCIGAGEGDFNFNIDDRWFMLIRQLVPNKIISYLDYSFMMDDTTGLDMLPMRYKNEDNTVISDFNPREIKMERLLFFGIWPGTGNGWNDPNIVERCRPMYQKYLPLFKAISEAGYEPVTNALTDDDNCRIERYGNIKDKDLYFTIRNYKMENKSYTITLDINLKDILVYDLKTLSPIECRADGKSIDFDISLKGLETGVVKVIKKGDLDNYKISMAQRQINNLKELINTENFWAEEEDNIKIREAIGEDLNNFSGKTVAEWTDFCKSLTDKTQSISGRSKTEADYLLDTAIKYLSM